MNNAKIKMLNVSILLSVSYAVLLIFIKYFTNGLSFSVSSLYQVGNLLDTLPAFIVIAAAAFVIFKKNKINSKMLFTGNLILLFSIPVLIAALIMTFVNISGYLPLINYPARKIILGLFFTVSYFMQLFGALTIFFLSMDEKYFAPLRAFYLGTGTLVLMVTFALLIILKTSNNSFHSNLDGNTKIAVVLGAAVWNRNSPSPLFEGRIEKAFELYKKGKIELIQVTGGSAPGEMSEAEVAGEELKKLGVPENRILLEDRTSTTAEQIKYIRNNLVEKYPESFAIISDSFHLRRIMEMSKFFDLNVNGISSNYKLNWRKSIYYYLRESAALLLFWLFAI